MGARGGGHEHYPEQPQLFDLEADPEELRDLGTDLAHAAVRKELHQRLLAMLDPEEVDRRAKARQAELVAAHGGREAVIRRGSFAYSPPITRNSSPATRFWSLPGRRSARAR